MSAAVAWYTKRDRIQTRRDRDGRLQSARRLGYRRGGRGGQCAVGVAAGQRGRPQHPGPGVDGNRRASHRARTDHRGRFSYRAGDRLVALAPDHHAGLVTSQRAVIDAVDPDAETVTVRTDDGRQVTLAGNQLSSDRLGYVDATTVHRCQGSTVDWGPPSRRWRRPELAYVGVSCARTGLDGLGGRRRHRRGRRRPYPRLGDPAYPTSALDTGLPDPSTTSPLEAAGQLDGQQRDQVVAIAAARATTAARTATSRPPRAARRPCRRPLALADARAALADLPSGEGTYRGTAIGEAASDALRASIELGRLEHESQHAQAPRGTPRRPPAPRRSTSGSGSRAPPPGPRETRDRPLHEVTATLEDRIAHLQADHQRLTHRWKASTNSAPPQPARLASSAGNSTGSGAASTDPASQLNHGHHDRRRPQSPTGLRRAANTRRARPLNSLMASASLLSPGTFTGF